MRKNVLPVIFLFALVVAVFFAHSQGNVPKHMPPLAPSTPIDGGVFLLLAAGLIYGGKVLYKKD
jgi:hypothetical protein